MTESVIPGLFLTLEGIDGAGKSTHVGFVRDYLTARGISLVVTREPGGTPVGESLRSLLLDVQSQVSLDTETLLMFAARQAHLDAVIRPALARGDWVLSDRFTDATYAFQGGGRGVSFARIAALENWVQQGLQPDRTFLFDVPLATAQARMHGVRQLDRFEQEASDFHARVRDAYLRRAADEPQRFCLLDARQSIGALQELLAQELDQLLVRSRA